MSAPRAVALCQCFNGALEFQAGNWDEAEAALRESIALYRELGAASGEALACQRLGVLYTARGRLDEALDTLEEGIAAAERAVMRAHCLTRLYAAMAHNRLAAGDVAAADQALTLGLAMGERHGHCTTCDALLLPAAVGVRVAQHDFEAAEEFCRQLAEEATQYGSRMWIAMAKQAHGELAAAQGELATALRHYRAARSAFSAAGYEYEAARCLAAMADILWERGDPGDDEEARRAQAEAQGIFERLGAA
ncbi:MAG: tetratricopeptide repeat protein [Chloroflexota bacterium]|nr:tetratricopeptide repeat protein [Chloroflexota bacterium]